MPTADVKIYTKLVVTEYNLNPVVKDMLDKDNIPVQVFRYADLKGDTKKEKNFQLSNHILDALQDYKIDYMISTGGHLLSGNLLKVYENRLINCHPSLLPMFPGIKAIDQAVENGQTFLVGNTIFFIDAGMDTGKIIMQSVIPLQTFFITIITTMLLWILW